MFLSEPSQTGYDIQFTLFGFPVRVHPLFFLAPLLFGQPLIMGVSNAGVALLVVTLVFFASILFHELGHALAFRFYGIDSRIVLHWMGGLAIPERNVWSRGGGAQPARLTPMQQVVVSIAGPLANVILAIAMIGIGMAIGGQMSWVQLIIPVPKLSFAATVFTGNEYFHLLFVATIVLNLLWAVFNMVPVFPFDGGQVARAIMQQMDGVDGVRNSLYLSLGVAVLMAVYSFSIEARFMGIFFGFMAYQNWQSLQQFSGRGW